MPRKHKKREKRAVTCFFEYRSNISVNYERKLCHACPLKEAAPERKLCHEASIVCVPDANYAWFMDQRRKLWSRREDFSWIGDLCLDFRSHRGLEKEVAEDKFLNYVDRSLFCWHREEEVGRDRRAFQTIGTPPRAWDAHFWIGERSSSYLDERGLPPHLPVCKVNEGLEPAVFRAALNWPETAPVPRGLLETKDYGSLETKVDVEELRKRKETKKEEVELSRVWRVRNFALEEVPPEGYGTFFSGDSYVVLYEPLRLVGPTVFFWIGRGSSLDEKVCPNNEVIKDSKETTDNWNISRVFPCDTEGVEFAQSTKEPRRSQPSPVCPLTLPNTTQQTKE
uniref:Gelsolin-like domain-containing protein n=1 Tax=Steinernema glaseri TaxID=37863 RepID=A0A1I7ZTC6_9BILA